MISLSRPGLVHYPEWRPDLISAFPTKAALHSNENAIMPRAPDSDFAG